MTLFAVGRGMPDWVAAGFAEYARRLPSHAGLTLREIAVGRGGTLDTVSGRRAEGRALLAAVGDRQHVVALDEGGEAWSTVDLVRHLDAWRQSGRDVAFLVGGADGLDPECLARAHQVWSLSRLTFPHLLVRVLVAEQLYRAFSLLQGHPYHRGTAPARSARTR